MSYIIIHVSLNNKYIYVYNIICILAIRVLFNIKHCGFEIKCSLSSASFCEYEPIIRFRFYTCQVLIDNVQERQVKFCEILMNW